MLGTWPTVKASWLPPLSCLPIILDVPCCEGDWPASGTKEKNFQKQWSQGLHEGRGSFYLVIFVQKESYLWNLHQSLVVQARGLEVKVKLYTTFLVWIYGTVLKYT